MPLLLFVILFGVDGLPRLHHQPDPGDVRPRREMDDAVAHGIKSTAGVVTSAAIVMVCVFAVFGTLSVPFFKQFGVGLAVAILLDATIVRACSAGDDEAARRVELVPAEVARVASRSSTTSPRLC